MAAPSFWEDGRRAQGLVQERSDLARAVGRFKELDREVEDLRTLWEMASEAGDESIGPEIAQQAAGLRDALAAFEIKVVLSGPHDGKNAILSIHPGAGGTESQDWAQMLMRMYLRWVERRGFQGRGRGPAPGRGGGHQVRHASPSPASTRTAT